MEGDVADKRATFDIGILIVIAGLFIWLCIPIITFMWHLWFGDIGHNNGVLIPVVSIYLIYEKRDHLRTLEAEYSWQGLIALLVASTIFLLGILGSERFTQEVAMVFLLIGIIWFNFGNQIMRVLAFPLLFLFLMIPPPMIFYAALSVRLQLISTKISIAFLHLLGVTVYNEGNAIYLPNMALEVAEVCSGIRSLFSLFTLGVIFAYIAQKRFWARIVLILSTIPLAILFNGIRISGTCILAEYWSPKITDHFNHLLSGWFIFVLAFGALLLVNKVIDRIRVALETNVV